MQFYTSLSLIYSFTTFRYIPTSLKIHTYADDLMIVSQHPRVDEAAIQLYQAVGETADHKPYISRRFKVLSYSSHVVTPFNKDYSLALTLSLFLLL